MSNFVAIRTYRLRPSLDRIAFEKVFGDVRPAMGLQKVLLLKGYQGNQPGAAKGEGDYVGLHVYESDEACSRFFRPVWEGSQQGQSTSDIITQYPKGLRSFLEVLAPLMREKWVKAPVTVTHQSREPCRRQTNWAALLPAGDSGPRRDAVDVLIAKGGA